MLALMITVIVPGRETQKFEALSSVRKEGPFHHEACEKRLASLEGFSLSTVP